MSEWGRVQIGDLLAEPLRNGVSYPSKLRGSGIPMVNMGEAFAFDVIKDQKCELVPLTEREQERFLLEEGDLLFVRQSLVYSGAGRCVLVGSGTGPRTWESHLIRARLDKRAADPRFLYYYFRSPQGRSNMETIVTQVAAAGIRGSDLKKLEIPHPSLSQQQGISNVLWALDGKIALNDHIATISEQLLQFKFSELELSNEPDDRGIAITELVEFNPKRTKPMNEEPVYVDMAALQTSRAGIPKWTLRSPKSGSRFMNGDTLLARITPCLENGKTGYVNFMEDGEVGLGSTEFIVMRSRPGVPSELSYFLARDSRFREHATRNMVGTSGRQRVSAADAANYFVNRPDPDALATFGREAAAAFTHMKSAQGENRALTALRDVLLPQLMSGRLRVKDAEKIVEDHV
ncbi:hypothetical protein AS594_39205 [Streptomyces agglomeratus]|uniref:Type I restriction modification DNA specificity domain-containing protein n=1 Tax=Streptomyces agglomeratus TaxID=285458 RepID=A0A1E5NZ23_9ACTN|nr:restriction endonuclease subunit S [Streptomyces agglomeratus]OEJ21563.1 hypothetical protein AS594_39205 [Streptomyces agglomeratus]